jgi:hypothetical protein
MTLHAKEFATSYSTPPTSILLLNVNIVVAISCIAAHAITKEICDGDV